MVGETGFAPARAGGPRVSETRVYTLHHSPKNECRRQGLHLHCQRSRRCASPVGLSRQKVWSHRGRLHPHPPPTKGPRLGLRFDGKSWGLERGSHPRPSPYEGAALTAAPSSREKWWGPRQLQPHVVPIKSRLPVYCGLIPETWLRQEEQHLHSRVQSPLSCC